MIVFTIPQNAHLCQSPAMEVIKITTSVIFYTDLGLVLGVAVFSFGTGEKHNDISPGLGRGRVFYRASLFCGSGAKTSGQNPLEKNPHLGLHILLYVLMASLSPCSASFLIMSHPFPRSLITPFPS